MFTNKNDAEYNDEKVTQLSFNSCSYKMWMIDNDYCQIYSVFSLVCRLIKITWCA